jgi:hypothetical protein
MIFSNFLESFLGAGVPSWQGILFVFIIINARPFCRPRPTLPLQFAFEGLKIAVSILWVWVKLNKLVKKWIFMAIYF